MPDDSQLNGSRPIPEEDRAGDVAVDEAPWILVVDDDASVRAVVVKVLGREGYGILEAVDGLHALEVAERHPGPLDLIVTDVVMPRMGGIELARRLQATRPEVRVIFMSGYVDDADHRFTVGSEAVDFLAKPFEPHALRHLVEEALHRND